MKKFKTLFALLVLSFFTIGNVWGAKYSMTPNQSSTGSSATSYITTLTGFTYASPAGSKIKWQMNQWNPKTLQIKTNSSASSEFRFYTDSVLPGKITKVVVTFSGLTLVSTTTTGFKFVGNTSKVTGTTGGTDGTWNSTAKTLTWTPGASDNYTFFAMYQNGKVATGTNNLASSDAIVVTYLTKVTLDKNEGTADGVAYFDDNATAASTATGYTFSEVTRDNFNCTGYYTASSDGVKVLNADGTFAAENVSGYITNSKWTYAGGTLKLYAQWEYAVACLNKVTITAGTPETGASFTLDKTGEQNCCEALVVTVSNITTPDGKKFSAITQSGINEELVTIDQNAKTVTYAENTSGSSTINVEFEDIPVYTVTFNKGAGTCGTASLTEESPEEGVTLPTATIGITGWSFAGWATASVTNTEVAPTLYAASSTYHPTENCTLYAVYKFTGDRGYKRATSVSEITGTDKIVIVSNANSKVLDNTFAGNVDAPEETDGKITAPAAAIFTLTGNNTDGYTLTNSTITVGATSTDNSTALSNTTSNDLWVVKAHNTSNTFYLENKGKENLSLEHYDGTWMVYAPKTPSTNSNMAMKVYFHDTPTVYNSNPAAIVNPTVAFTTSGDKNLYVQDEASYTNAANVTGISKAPVYSSSDATVATVSDAGVVTALKVGTATITAKVEAEVGVNTEATATYEVTVKDAKTIAGLKGIASTSSVVAFTADLTDAVVTYVNGNYAYIQDASGAVYASCGSSLTAGNKINGAVIGSIKASNQIDEITSITLSEATVTEDGVIPAAVVTTAADLVTNKASLEGKLVSIANATVTASLTNGNASGGKISDDGKTTEINLYAPKSNIEALAGAEGTFNGYITLYGGSTIRLNIYEQSQISLTKNAPTDQTLSFASNAIVLDKPSAEYSAFTGQTVSGAKTTPRYSIEEGDDEDGVVTSINSETGAIVLSGVAGTATITATAPAGNTEEGGVITPWKDATKTYTITVRYIYAVDLVIKVDGVEAAYGNTATIAGGTETVHKLAGETAALAAVRATGYQFVNWTASTEDITIANANQTSATATINADGTVYANFHAVPELLVSVTELDLKYAKLNAEPVAQTFTIQGASLAEGTLTLTLADNIKDAFIVSPNTVDVKGTLATTTITVTPVTTKAGNYSGNLTIAGGGLAAAKTVALTSEIEQTYTVTWSVNGQTTTQTDIAGTTLNAPATGSITGKVSQGWTDAVIDGKTNTKPTIVTLTTMPDKDTTLYALYATENSVDSVLEFGYTIVPGDFGNSGYDSNSTKTKTATCNTTGYTSETVSIQFTADQVMNNQSKIQGKKSVGVIYNANAWGKEIKSVTINNNSSNYYSYTIGTSSKPTSSAKGAYFQVYVNSNNTAYASSIEIVFDSTVTVKTYDAYITNAYAVNFTATSELGDIAVKNGDDEIESGDLFPKGTEFTVVTTPADGYMLSVLKANTTDITTTKAFTMGSEAVNVTATFVADSGTGIDNAEEAVKAVKVIENDQVIIIRGNKRYTVQGQLIR